MVNRNLQGAMSVFILLALILAVLIFLPQSYLPATSGTPTSTPQDTITPTSTNTIFTVHIKFDTACRSGPGEGYETVTTVSQGKDAMLIARDKEPAEWLLVRPAGLRDCWVDGKFIVSPDISAVAIFPTPQPPTKTPVPSDTPVYTSQTPNITQTIQAAFHEVDEQFKEALRANIAYNVPKSMKLGDTITIELLLKPSQYQLEQATQLVEQNNFLTSTAEAGVLATKVIEEGGFLTSTAEPGQPVGKGGEEQDVITSDVIITPLMKAVVRSIKPGAFEIQELHDSAVQPIGSVDPTKWRWSVTAKEPGEQSLELVISRLVKQGDNEYWREVEAYRADINVEVTAPVWLKSLDWKWILGILVTALLIPLFFRWYDQRQKKALPESQDKQGKKTNQKSKPASGSSSSKEKRSRNIK